MLMPPNDTEAPLDGDLELKKRSRRRLVGAIALALLAIVVLPMVMDHEPRPSTQDIQVRIPSQDTGGFTSRIVPANPAVAPSGRTDAKVDAKPDAKAETKPDAKAETKPEAKAESPAETKVAEAKKVPEAKPETKPATGDTTKPSEKPLAKPAAPAKQSDQPLAKAEEARAKAALNGATIADQWVVQLGAYKEGANVKHLTAKLKELGLPSYTEQFKSPQGPRTRVRAGPFASREAADKALKKIKAIGIGGTVAQQ
jgi:DedD protein